MRFFLPILVEFELVSFVNTIFFVAVDKLSKEIATLKLKINTKSISQVYNEKLEKMLRRANGETTNDEDRESVILDESSNTGNNIKVKLNIVLEHFYGRMDENVSEWLVERTNGGGWLDKGKQSSPQLRTVRKIEYSWNEKHSTEQPMYITRGFF